MSMGINQTPIRITLSPSEKDALESMARRTAASHRSVVRATLVLLVAAGMPLSKVSKAAGVARRIVRKWALRFVEFRLDGLEDKPRSGRPARFSPHSDRSPRQARLRTAG